MQYGDDELMNRLEALESELEALNVKEIVKARTQEQIEAMLGSTQELIGLYRQRQREIETERRLADAFEQLVKVADASNRRLEQIEQKAAVEPLGRPRFAKYDDLEAEGSWLRDELGGPPPNSAHAEFGHLAQQAEYQGSLEVLAVALAASLGSAKKKAAP